MLAKDRLDHFNSALNAIKGLGLVFLVFPTLLYFLFPSFEIFIKDRVLDESRHFWVGTWDSKSKVITGGVYDMDVSDYDPASGLVKKGTVILAAGKIVGRSEYGTSEGLRTFVAKDGDCLLVLHSQAREYGPDKTIQIWVRALPNACK